MIDRLLKNLKTVVRARRTVVSQYFRWFRLMMVHHEQPVPIYMSVEQDGVSVHIGSGMINLQGWINIDARQFSHTHVLADDFELRIFTDETIKQFYLCHVLEHFSHNDVIKILSTLFEKLQPGGRIIISVPDFSKLVDVFIENGKDIGVIRSALMGGQNYEYNFHRSIFTEQSLSYLLNQAGFNSIMSWEVKDVFGVDLGDWSSREIPTKKGTRFISLNLLATKSPKV
jgi:predicted SAM-dependent methyltransferase